MRADWLVLLATAILLAPGHAHPQLSPPPAPGSFVRVTIDSDRYTAWTHGTRGDMLLLHVPGIAVSDTIVVPFAKLRQLDVGRGRSRVVSAERGAIIGGLVGATLMAITLFTSGRYEPDLREEYVRAGVSLLVVSAGISSGLVGGAIGFALPPREHWRRVYP